MEKKNGETEEQEVRVEVGVGTEGVKRGVFPCLEGIRMEEKVCGLPIVESFIAVRDWGEESGESTDGKEKNERDKEGMEGKSSGCRLFG